VSQRRRKSERTKKLHFQGLFAYSEKFSKKKTSGNMYNMKGIFSDQIIFMVHIPFKFIFSKTSQQSVTLSNILYNIIS